MNWTVQSSLVILKSSETTPEHLNAKFGHCYAEANSEPRRFVINITEDVQNLLCTYRNVEQNAMYTSYLVFIFDGVYDEDVDTYKVIFNSNICRETLTISKNIPFEETTFEEIMNRVASTLLDMKQEDLLDLSYNSLEKTVKPRLNFIREVLGVKVDILNISNEISRVPEIDMNRECAVMTNSWIDTARNMDFDIFCNICFENINTSETGSSSGTKLLQCCHIFCDNCWRSHLRTKLKNGGVTITCPGYECEEVVDSATLLSLLHVSDVNKLLHRERENEVKTSPICKWCPNPNCGRVMRLDRSTLAKDFSVDVTCSCGNEVCFSCLSRPHWPAKCHQAKDYMSNRLTLASKIETKDELNSQDLLLKPTLLSRKDSQVLEIEGRSCPNCSEFLQRNGGSTQMNCKCGHMFCWTCLKPYRTHTFCIPYASFIFSYAQKIITFSNDLSPTNESTNFARNKLCKVDTRYKKAQQQRLESNQVKLYKQIKEILEKIARITHKDLQLKREILSICKVKIDNTDETIISPCSFIPHVLKFLRSCHEIKLALHHVAEFTFVLLQDAPDSVDKRRIFRLANDLSAYCNFMKTILESVEKQDMRTAIRRLADIQIWAKEAIVANISSINRLKRETTH